MSITFSAICLTILKPCRIQNPDSDPDPSQNLTKLCRPPQLLTHKISSKFVYNFFRYPAEIQKSGVNPVPGSELWSGSGSKPNQFVQVSPRLSTHKISSKSDHNFFRYPAERQKSGANPVWRSATRRWILLTYARQFLLWAYFTYLLWLWILCVGLF